MAATTGTASSLLSHTRWFDTDAKSYLLKGGTAFIELLHLLFYTATDACITSADLVISWQQTSHSLVYILCQAVATRPRSGLILAIQTDSRVCRSCAVHHDLSTLQSKSISLHACCSMPFWSCASVSWHQTRYLIAAGVNSTLPIYPVSTLSWVYLWGAVESLRRQSALQKPS